MACCNKLPGIGDVKCEGVKMNQPIGCIGVVSSIKKSKWKLSFKIDNSFIQMQIPDIMPEWLKDGQRVEVDLILNQIIKR